MAAIQGTHIGRYSSHDKCNLFKISINLIAPDRAQAETEEGKLDFHLLFFRHSICTLIGFFVLNESCISFIFHEHGMMQQDVFWGNTKPRTFLQTANFFDIVTLKQV